nr:adhesion G protein-coupled receptor E4-like isoform X2 [Microcebus murinus]
MGSRCLLLLSGLGVLLAVPGPEGRSSAALCPQCPEHASCHNSTHCACEVGFQSSSGRRHFLSSQETCEDIDECATELHMCKYGAYCRNKIGGYICSCVAAHPIFNWVAGLVDIDHPDCYENSERKASPVKTQENLRKTRSPREIGREDTALCETGQAKCHDTAHCKNKIVAIVCTCVVKYPFFNWEARLVDIDHPDCYEKNEGKQSPVNTQENLMENESIKDPLRNATELQSILLTFWNVSSDSPGKVESSAFYGGKRCRVDSCDLHRGVGPGMGRVYE